ncbi:MFS transporter [Pseudonocardia sp. CA-107938]|uniref:MFS transporter n=1 Tax=Pseudonocardia sp. CA-107938 TaxID=3240021 RepID=UPI003D8A0EE7
MRTNVSLVGISLGYFMVLLDTTVVAVAEPDLAVSLGASVRGLQWVTTAYTVVFAALLLSAGAVADTAGARRTFRTAVLSFGALSALCAAAPTVEVLIGLRALLGAAAAACVPASLVLVARLHPEPARRARAVATWATISGSAVALGPVVGGVLVGAAGWRAAFLVNVPVAMAVLAATAGRAGEQRSARRIDLRSHAAVIAALALGTDALIAAGAGAWAHAGLSAVGAAVIGAVLVRVDRTSDAPALDPAVLGVRGVPAGLIAGAAVNLTLAGTLFVLPLVLAGRFGPLGTGLALLPMTVPFVANPPVTARLVARRGPRPAILLGLGLLAAGTAALAGAVALDAPYPVLAAGLLGVGFGVSFALPALAGSTVSAVPAEVAGAAGGMLNAARQAGATVGVAVMGALPGGASFLPATAACLLAALVYARARRETTEPVR